MAPSARDGRRASSARRRSRRSFAARTSCTSSITACGTARPTSRWSSSRASRSRPSRARRQRLDAATTHRVVAHVARALTRAHAIGIVHRDLKPENIFLVPGDDGEIAKVLDFGVAKWNTRLGRQQRHQDGLLVGTPLYMSPEQARGTKEIDFRADLWSLAVIAFQCITGDASVLERGARRSAREDHVRADPGAELDRAFLPARVRRWWARASSREMEYRFQSAKELGRLPRRRSRLSSGVDGRRRAARSSRSEPAATTASR